MYAYVFLKKTGEDEGDHFHSFLLESLADLNQSLEKVGTILNVFFGDPVDVIRHLHASYSIKKLCFEQDCEPKCYARDDAVKSILNILLFHNVLTEENHDHFKF